MMITESSFLALVYPACSKYYIIKYVSFYSEETVCINCLLPDWLLVATFLSGVFPRPKSTYHT